jgi:ADP-heptose:LPS heptosyltransferase
MSFWRVVNLAAYRVWYAARHRRARRARSVLERDVAAGLAEGAPDAPTGPEPRVLFLSWGMIGDALLATSMLRHWRALFPEHRLVCLGRAATEPVLAPLVDEFIGYEPDLWDRIASARRAVVARLRGDFELLVGDIHLFYGGTFRFKELIERLPAGRKFLYEGYHLGPELAPQRLDPEGVETIPALRKPARPDPSDPARSHVLLDYHHYLGRILVRLGRGQDAPSGVAPPLPPPAGSEDEDHALLAELGLEAGRYLAWQPASNNRKKDYPAAAWRRVLERFPDRRFVALGSVKESEKLGGSPGGNVLDLCGKTDLGQAMRVIRHARAYVGLDSGLTHIAAALRVPTVCVSQSSNLGSFFPYPAELGFHHLRVVHDPAYLECAGCFMTCSRESIVRTRLAGARCLRDLAPERVAEAVAGALDASA